MRLKRIGPVANAFFLILFTAHLGHSGEDKTDERWVDVSSPTVRKLTDAGQKTAWPGETAGVTVDPASGDVYLIVTGLGVWKSTDIGKTFARVDGGKVGGRCETSFALNADSGGKRLACFMLDGKCAWSGDSGQTWTPFTDVGRNWDYAAVDWSADGVKTIFAALHESGGKVMFSADGGQTWSKLFEDAEFDKTGGLGIFDAKTLVYTQKGKGIQRSTDGGQTWTKTADREPLGRLVNIYKGKAYWLTKEGLLVSTDKGATWKVQGQAVEASIGPYFDPKDEKRIVVAGAKGIFQTDDSGESWKLVSRLPMGFEKLPKAGWFTNVAWDPVHNVFYASHMGKPTYRLGGVK
ncbi:MAG: BNR/Asp-box repeat protein [Planctomycetaceae bacterium]|nr:BNR/Asp-box repeat protein [Planctomycetaceae bacterium]